MNTAVQFNYNFNRANRVLACRAHVKAFYYFLTGAASLWLLLGLATLATFGLNENNSGVFWSAIFGFGLPAVLLATARFVIRPVAFTRAELKPDSLIVRNDDREKELFFKDVDQVNLTHIPFIAGWMKIVMKDGSAYTLSVALERSEYILDALMQFNPKLADQEKVHNYRLTAIYYDHSWARLVDRISNRRKLSVKYMLGAIILPIAYNATVLAQHGQAKPNIYQFILLAVGSFLFLTALGGALWFLSETLVLSPMSRKTLKHDATRPVRPVEFEKRVELLADLAFLGVVIGCFVLIS